jgi:hypothetical protein
MCSIISLLTAHPAHSFLLLHPVPVLCLLVPTSKSRHHFPFFRALSPQIHRNILCHAPLILPVVPRFSDSLPSLLLVRISVPLAQLRTHPYSFRSHSFHFLTGIPVPPAVLLSLLLIRSFSFLYSTQSVSCTLPFRPFCPRTLPLSFPLSLSACSSCTLPSLCTLVFLCPLLAPISNISLALSPPPPVTSIPISLLRTSARSPPCSRTSSFSSRTRLRTFSLLFPTHIQLPCSPSSLPLSLAPCLWLSR